MYKCPHLGACYNTTTNIWDNFFISKIFLQEIAKKGSKKHLLLRVTSHFSRESTSQASGTDIFISKTRLRHALCMRK